MHNKYRCITKIHTRKLYTQCCIPTDSNRSQTNTKHQNYFNSNKVPIGIFIVAPQNIHTHTHAHNIYTFFLQLIYIDSSYRSNQSYAFWLRFVTKAAYRSFYTVYLVFFFFIPTTAAAIYVLAVLTAHGDNNTYREILLWFFRHFPFIKICNTEWDRKVIKKIFKRENYLKNIMLVRCAIHW